MDSSMVFKLSRADDNVVLIVCATSIVSLLTKLVGIL